MVIPVGESLKELLKKEVVKSGDGLSLGLSQHMMKFFTMEGPFIGTCLVHVQLLCMYKYMYKL